MEDLLRVGVISSTHGVRGEVKVYPTTDDLERFQLLKHVILDTGKEKKELEVQGVKFFKQFAILKFKGIDNINDIEKYKGKDLLIKREDAVELEEGEYFICDLMECTAISDTGETLGKLTEVIQTGANDVFVIQKKDGKELLIPYTKECVLDVNMDEKTILVHVLPGLED